jgi:hypothetical protein
MEKVPYHSTARGSALQHLLSNLGDTTSLRLEERNMGQRLNDDLLRGARLTHRCLAVLCLSLLLGLQTGCYHYRVYGEQVPVGSEAKRATLWSSLWGTRQQNINTDQTCVNNPTAEVTMSGNFGYTLLTVLSLGFVSPIDVEWKCAKDRPTGGGSSFGG